LLYQLGQEGNLSLGCYPTENWYKTASEINRVTEKLFQKIPVEKRKTFTCDKVKEFFGHQDLSQKSIEYFPSFSIACS
jgi:IS30 family transposase